MRNNNFAKKSRPASLFAGDECSPGCGHVGLQLLDTLEKPDSWDFQQPYWLSGQISHEKKITLKIKSLDMQNQRTIIIIMRWFPKIITYFKIRRSVLARKICSLQVFQSSVFFQETTPFFVDCCCWFPTKVNVCLYTAAALFSLAINNYMPTDYRKS